MRAEQRQILAPRMILSMKVLQLPMLALAEHVEQAMMENPMLDGADAPDDLDPSNSPTDDDATPWGDLPAADSPALQNGIAEAASPESSSESTNPDPAGSPEPILDESPGDEPELHITDDGARQDEFDRLDDYSETLENVWEAADMHAGRYDEDRDRKAEMMALAPDRQRPLSEDLAEQFAMLDCPPLVRAAGKLILEQLDSAGFLSIPLDQLPRVAGPESPLKLDHFVDALLKIQDLDPPGVGARDLRECLLIQLERLDPELDTHGLRPIAANIVHDHFQDLQQNRIPAIAKALQLPLTTIESAITLIGQHCNPSPASSVDPTPNQPVTPDIILELDESRNDYDVIITDTYLPPLQISRQYREQLESGQLDKQTRDYLLAKLRDARWLIDAIEQRRDTLRKVTREVVRTQRDFIEHGPRFLKPLPMQEVADKVGVHIATVSRAVSDKYVQCPRGIFKLRDCFSSGTQTDDGESVSYDAIRERVRDIIQNEDRRNPLSDDAIVELLKKDGITLARRTVAKYRGELNIPTARQRRQF